MFKYGSFKNFVIKFFVGTVLFIFGLIYLTSLYSFSPNDPGFNQYNYNTNNIKISNLMGLFGAHLSSYSLIFIGTLSYLLAFFITTEGGKLFLGIANRFVILKFLSNLTGITIINVFLRSVDIKYLNTGLISQFLVDLFTSINLNLAENIFIYFIVNFLLLILGIVLVLLSFKINLSWINKITSFLKFLKYFKVLFSIFKLLKYIRFKKSSTKKTLRSEPTIRKTNYINLKREKNLKSKPEKQLEIDSFSFTLPSTDLLSKSNLRNNKNKELDKINENAALKLEKTLSEYGVDGKIIGFSSGPIVTLFEFVPNAGI